MRSLEAMLVIMASATACSVGGTAAPTSPPPAEVLPPPLLNGCAQADFDANDKRLPDGDAGAADRTITFPKALPVAQYTPHCMEIKVGESVTWTGGFDITPMEAFPKDPNNPIAVTDFGFGSVSFTFPKAGLYGFHCRDHSSNMFGAIYVVAP